MPRTLYSPRLSDDVIRLLYREGKRRSQPMTKLADELLRQSLAGFSGDSLAPSQVREDSPDSQPPGAR